MFSMFSLLKTDYETHGPLQHTFRELSSSTFSMRTRIVSNSDWQACRLQSNFYSFSVYHTFRISRLPVTWYVLIGLETLLKGIKTFPRHIFFPFLVLSSSYIFLSSKAAGFRRNLWLIIDSPSSYNIIKMRFTSMFVAALPFIGSVFAAPLVEKALTPTTSDLTKKDVDILSVITELQTRVVCLFTMYLGHS